MSDVVPSTPLRAGLRCGAERLGLFGFVFSSREGRNIGVSLSGIRGCVGFGLLGIGFVLHNRPNTTENAENAEKIGLRQDGQDGQVWHFGAERRD